MTALISDQVNGTAFINRTSAVIEVSASHPEGVTYRLQLVQASLVVGGFGTISVKHGSTDHDGKCHEDYVSATDATKGSLSVLVTTRPVACKGKTALVVPIIVISVIGGAVILLGLLYVWRDAALSWARSGAAEEEALVR